MMERHQAEAIREQKREAQHKRLAEAHNSLAMLANSLGRLKKTESLHEAHKHLLHSLALIRYELGQPVKTLELSQTAENNYLDVTMVLEDGATC